MSLVNGTTETDEPSALADTSTRAAAAHADTTMMSLVSKVCSGPVGAWKCVGRIATVAGFYNVNAR
jgi:hypothetical protein